METSLSEISRINVRLPECVASQQEGAKYSRYIARHVSQDSTSAYGSKTFGFPQSACVVLLSLNTFVHMETMNFHVPINVLKQASKVLNVMLLCGESMCSFVLPCTL